MKTGMRIGLLMSVATLAVASPFRVLWRGTGGWGDKSAYCSLFNPNTVETVTGVIQSVDSITPMPGMREGIELQLKTAKRLIPIHLGPQWYLENQDIELKAQDSVDVVGSRVFCVNQDVIMATEVRKGDKVIKLRDTKGRPLWVAAVPTPAQP